MHVLSQVEALRADVVVARVNAGLPHAGTTIVDERPHSSGQRAGSGEPEYVVAQAFIEEESGALNNMFGCICAKRFCQCTPEEQADLAIWVRVWSEMMSDAHSLDVATFRILLHSCAHTTLVSLLISLQLRQLVDFDTGGGMDLPAREVAGIRWPHLSSSWAWELRTVLSGVHEGHLSHPSWRYGRP
jgi:hypothetical protein